MQTAEQCRAHTAEYKVLGTARGISVRRATALMGTRSWRVPANQLDRLPEIEIDEGEKVASTFVSFLAIITTGISVEGRWKLALAEDNRRLVIIVAHFWKKATTPSLLNASLSAVRSGPVSVLQAIGASAFRLPPCRR